MAERTLTHRRLGRYHLFKPLRDKGEFLDVKILCSDSNPADFVFGHRAVLAAVSTILKKKMKKQTSIDDPIILKHHKYSSIALIVDFIYQGRINIPEDKIDEFLDSYRCLNIKLGGLADKFCYDLDYCNEEDATSTIVDDTETGNVVSTHTTSVTIKEEVNKNNSPSNSGIGEPTFSDALISLAENKGPIQQHDNSILEHQSPQLNKLPQLLLQPNNQQRGPLVKRAAMDLEELDKAAAAAMQTAPSRSDRSNGKNSCKEGPGGFYWFMVENINSESMQNTVFNTCKRFGEVIDFLQDPQLSHVTYVAFKSEKEATDAVNTLKICQQELPVTHVNVLPSVFDCLYAPLTDSKDMLLANANAFMRMKACMPPPTNLSPSTLTQPCTPYIPPPTNLPPSTLTQKPPEYIPSPTNLPPSQSPPSCIPPSTTFPPSTLTQPSKPCMPLPTNFPPFTLAQPPPPINLPSPQLHSKDMSLSSRILDQPPHTNQLLVDQPSNNNPLSNQRAPQLPSLLTLDLGTLCQPSLGNLAPIRQAPNLDATSEQVEKNAKAGANPNLWVCFGNLSNGVNKLRLTSFLQNKVTFNQRSMQIISEGNKTFAFIKCLTANDAENTINKLHGHKFMGREMTVKYHVRGKSSQRRSVKTFQPSGVGEQNEERRFLETSIQRPYGDMEIGDGEDSVKSPDISVPVHAAMRRNTWRGGWNTSGRGSHNKTSTHHDSTGVILCEPDTSQP